MNGSCATNAAENHAERPAETGTAAPNCATADPTTQSPAGEAGEPGKALAKTSNGRHPRNTDIIARQYKYRRSLRDRVEAFISRLSTKNNFWHRVCSLIWLPFAFRSGIRMKRIDASTFAAVLPFKRVNRNWYNAMAGAALLANSEIAGGMFVFAACGAEYTVVCKHLEYKFLRPCFGPALYRITPRESIDELTGKGGEFNITIDLDVVQQIGKRGGHEKRVGRCVATFHVTPKTHYKAKKKARRERALSS